MAAGDARRALRILEIAVLSVEENTPITPEIIEESAQQKLLRHDRSGDAHYDLASALIKSIRGSDPDSALYWMARMIAGGEDPRFIARRLVIAAAEDIGNADPQALIIAQAAADAVAFIGLPEGRIPLAQAAIYLALAPKSNSTISSIDAALEDVRSEATLPVPKPLRDAHYPGAKALGHGTEYQNPHRSPEGFLPDAGGGVGRQYYEPVRRGREIELAERLDEIRRRRAEQSGRDLDAAEE